MNRTVLFLAALTAVACSGKDDTADTAAADCGVTVTSFPENGAVDAYYRNYVQFYLSDADPETTPTITVDGVDGTSTLSEDGETVTFTPSAPLSPSTSYTASLSYCMGSADISFTTSSYGSALSDESALVGKAYDLDLGSGTIVEPPGVGSILESYLDYTIYMAVDSVGGGNIQLIGAVADEDDPSHQDYCTPTLDFPEASFADSPYFEIGPETTTLSVADYNITIDDLYISGTFAADGSAVGGAQLAGSIDTRPLASLVGEDESEDAICSLVSGFGISCETCSDGEPYCLSIEVINLSANAADTEIVYVENEDCHELCDASAENAECDLGGGDGGSDTGAP